MKVLFMHNAVHAFHQEIVRAVSIAGDVIKELAKLGEADRGVVEQKSNEFLGIVKVALLLCCKSRTSHDSFDYIRVIVIFKVDIGSLELAAGGSGSTIASHSQICQGHP